MGIVAEDINNDCNRGRVLAAGCCWSLHHFTEWLMNFTWIQPEIPTRRHFLVPNCAPPWLHWLIEEFRPTKRQWSCLLLSDRGKHGPFQWRPFSQQTQKQPSFSHPKAVWSNEHCMMHPHKAPDMEASVFYLDKSHCMTCSRAVAFSNLAKSRCKERSISFGWRRCHFWGGLSTAQGIGSIRYVLGISGQISMHWGQHWSLSTAHHAAVSHS